MKIAFIGQPEYFRAFYENDLNDIYEVKEFSLNFNMNENDFNELISFNANYNIFFRGEFVPNSVLQRLNGYKIALSSEPFPNYINDKLNYTKDSLYRFITFENIRNLEFDYVFHYDKSSLRFMQEHELLLSGEFILPVATGTYKRMQVEKKWDIFFIGRSTEYREKFLGNLKHYNNVLHIAHGVFGDDLVKYCNQSKIVLNLHAENEVSWEPRMQILLATGAFVVSHKITPNEYLIPNEDFVEVSMDDPMDIYEKVNYYLNDKEARDNISEHGYTKIQDNFKASTAFQSLIDGIHADKYTKFKASPQKASLIRLKFFSNVNKILKKLGLMS